MSRAPAFRGLGATLRSDCVRDWAWALWAVLVLAVSVVPAEWLLGAAPRGAWSVLSSAAHAIEFCVLTVLLFWRSSVQPKPARKLGSGVLCCAGAAFALAVVVEAVQWLLPYRSFEARDLAADAAGIAAALAFSCLIFRGAGRRCGR